MKRFIWLGCLFGISSSAFAYEFGGTLVYGHSGKEGANVTCNECHSGGQLPGVTLTGPNALTAGEQGTFTFTMTGGAGIVGGLDVALSDSLATLISTDPNTAIVTQRNKPGELIHTRAIPFQDGPNNTRVLTLSFVVQAPPFGGPLTIYAAGNSTNDQLNDTGDKASTTTFVIDVQGPDASVDPVADGGNPAEDGGGTSADSGGKTADGGAPGADLGGAQPDQGDVKSGDAGGCAIRGPSSARSAAPLCAFALVLLIGRIHRRSRPLAR
jgi:hypothetical protein